MNPALEPEACDMWPGCRLFVPQVLQGMAVSVSVLLLLRLTGLVVGCARGRDSVVLGVVVPVVPCVQRSLAPHCA